MDLNEWADYEEAAAERAWREEAEAEYDEGEDFGEYIREDFGWFGDEALFGGE